MQIQLMKKYLTCQIVSCWQSYIYPKYSDTLMHSTLGKISADDKLKYFFLVFSQKMGFDISCKLSPMETICVVKSFFSGKNKKICQFVIC